LQDLQAVAHEGVFPKKNVNDNEECCVKGWSIKANHVNPWLIGLMSVLFLIAMLALAISYIGDRPSPNVDQRTFAVAWERYGTERQSLFSFNRTQEMSQKAELIQPQSLLPRSFRYDSEQIKKLWVLMQRCEPVDAFDDPDLDKARVWQEYLCGKSSLPHDFFERSPSMHPLGQSYYARARDTQQAAFLNPEFQKAHVTRMHVLEAKSPLEQQWLKNQDPLLYYLSYVHDQGLNDLLGSYPLVLGDVYSLVSLGEDEELGLYHVVRSEELLSFISSEGFGLVERGHGDCALKKGGTCWTSVDRFGTLKIAIIVLLGLTLSGLSVLVIRFSYLTNRKRIDFEQDRIFVLQTLAHEIRTPATGIVLAAESLRDGFDLLPDELQDAYLRLCADIQRLQRVITTSTRYLRAEQDADKLQLQTLDSVTDFLQSILEPYEKQIALDIELDDRSFTSDFQWLTVCVTNLIDNALNHGVGPVVVRARFDGPMLLVAVADQGQLPGFDLERQVRPFAKSRTSKGLGLGLTIVKKIAVVLGGKLQYDGPPTQFGLLLPDLSQDPDRRGET